MDRSQRHDRHVLTRRSFLQRGLSAAGALSLGALGGSAGLRPGLAWASAGADSFGALLPADVNGARLPPGFTSRIVAIALEPVGPTSFPWPERPDGGATFSTGDGGWIYVANSEISGSGGASAIRFAANGDIVDSYSILTGTDRNCAGGPTPWGTWLSCEEVNGGRTWECDPFQASQGVELPALGTFKHEAAAVDPVHEIVYQTEDLIDGLLYRFLPTAYPDLSAGALEAAEILDPMGNGPIQPGEVRPLAWHPVPAPNPPRGGPDDARHLPVAERATRFQVSAATVFQRGEGAWFEEGVVYFATTADHRVWALDTVAQTIQIIYDRATSGDPELSGPDNVFVSKTGDVYVAEDNGNMEIVALTPSGDVKPVVQVEGHGGSEICGPALSPDGDRLYFSSQRGPTPSGNLGVTFEIEGPWICGPTSVDETRDGPRLALAVAPNPFRAGTTLRFSMAAAGLARMSVYDVTGRRVRTLLDAPRAAGTHALYWDGRDSRGRRAAPGMYVARLEAAGVVAARKLYRRG